MVALPTDPESLLRMVAQRGWQFDLEETPFPLDKWPRRWVLSARVSTGTHECGVRFAGNQQQPTSEERNEILYQCITRALREWG